jgi:hypothetical protein
VFIDTGRGPGPSFDHLVFHSDSEGCYLPIEFDKVILTAGPDWLQEIGSAASLKRKCEILASAIGLPLYMDPDGEEIWTARADYSRTDVERRRTFGIESFI